MIVLGSKKDSLRKGGDIVTDQAFTNFELELDFKVSTKGNSGVKYFVIEDRTKKPGTGLVPEFQILDDKAHPDAKEGVNGNRSTGSLYDLITAENLSEGTTARRMNPPGKWNKLRIKVSGGHTDHWLSKLKAVEYDRYSQTFHNLWPKANTKRVPVLHGHHPATSCSRIMVMKSVSGV